MKFLHFHCLIPYLSFALEKCYQYFAAIITAEILRLLKILFQIHLQFFKSIQIHVLSVCIIMVNIVSVTILMLVKYLFLSFC